MLSGKRILLGVTGGIAAYKSVYLLRKYQKLGARVRVMMTPAATRFVGTETFAALSRQTVAVDVFNDNETDPGGWTKHIHWADWADLLVVAPCTANTLSKVISGAADNMLTSTLLAARCPVLLCPTMDGEMYENEAVKQNLSTAKKRGFYILEPESGYLASGLEDVGRLPEIDIITDKSEKIIKTHAITGPLSGKNVLVTAGPTREHLDPVRFLSNPSSGKMGIAMAAAAQKMGGDVTLLCGPTAEAVPDQLHTLTYTSAQELFELVQKFSDSDLLIMAAAVSDYRPKQVNEQKIKKNDEALHLTFIQNPDILEWFGKNKRDGQIAIGFAMETENLQENAAAKLQRKNIDWICANQINQSGTGFAAHENSILLISKDDIKKFKGTKTDISFEILRYIFA